MGAEIGGPRLLASPPPPPPGEGWRLHNSRGPSPPPILPRNMESWGKPLVHVPVPESIEGLNIDEGSTGASEGALAGARSVLLNKEEELRHAKGTIQVLQHQLVDNLAGRPYNQSRSQLNDRLIHATKEEVLTLTLTLTLKPRH